MGAMEPRPHERSAGGSLRLSDLILVVREDEVHAARVDVERLAEVGHAHRRALQVPAGPSRPDRGLPAGLARLGGLPEDEVADIILRILVGGHPLPHPHGVGIQPGHAYRTDDGSIFFRIASW